ncbi:hypothetical protein MNBD_BACTEROID02-207 [hydrothermal vent metagenome]|uniref:Uncharacterized protein n=1 Tax=hydrothermal vent metagenome TaxID=652676 RepID=A0A3B0RDF2_9ZZZZ
MQVTDRSFLLKNGNRININDTSDLMNNGYLNKNN